MTYLNLAKNYTLEKVPYCFVGHWPTFDLLAYEWPFFGHVPIFVFKEKHFYYLKCKVLSIHTAMPDQINKMANNEIKNWFFAKKKINS
jgi:hypothetical protein